MARNLFRKPFDEGTIDKLKIFEDYFKEWLPVFISRQTIIWPEIKVFDLFAGEGKDLNGLPGSPMRILSILNENSNLITKSKVKIRVIVNEFNREKFELLSQNLVSIENELLYTLELHNDDFTVVFNSYFESMKHSANFLFLDQNGIKQITEDVFSKLVSLKHTDFLFFISSSYIIKNNSRKPHKKSPACIDCRRGFWLLFVDRRRNPPYRVESSPGPLFTTAIAVEKQDMCCPAAGIFCLAHTASLTRCWRFSLFTGSKHLFLVTQVLLFITVAHARLTQLRFYQQASAIQGWLRTGHNQHGSAPVCQPGIWGSG